MYAHDDLKSLYGFLRSTGEGGLKKMLLGGKMTETHLRLLMKIVRTLGENDFVTHVEAESFPKIKLAASEIAIKEGFWPTCLDACAKVGLVSAQKAA